MPGIARFVEGCEPSTAIMLAEHDRLAALYLHNAQMGEQRTSLYLTVISAALAALLGLVQFGAGFPLWTTMGIWAALFVLGLVIFQRLIERRVRGTEYLRAINRIHRYFVERDPALEPYLYWPPCDDQPCFQGEGAAMTGLRDVVALLNSLFAGLLAGEMLWLAMPAAFWGRYLVCGACASLLAWLGQQHYEHRFLANAERQGRRHIHYPQGREQPDA
jgi:hypothetical protein